MNKIYASLIFHRTTFSESRKKTRNFLKYVYRTYRSDIRIDLRRKKIFEEIFLTLMEKNMKSQARKAMERDSRIEKSVDFEN